MYKWKGKSVLIAGGANMIGSHVARTLLERGAEVCVADNLSSGILRNIEDITDSVRCERIGARPLSVGIGELAV